jgi:pimeloyl-ACP methyl ester carboxylesterase
MPYSLSNKMKIYYEASWDGVPFVLVHANPFDRRMFIYQMARFSTFFKVINIDLRGYGYSDKPAVPITMKDYATMLWPCAGRRACRKRSFSALASVA